MDPQFLASFWVQNSHLFGKFAQENTNLMRRENKFCCRVRNSRLGVTTLFTVVLFIRIQICRLWRYRKCRLWRYRKCRL